MLALLTCSFLTMGITFAMSESCVGCTPLQVTIPASTPAVAVPADFFGFGFESGLLPHYDNEFSNNTVNSIQSRMLKPMVIRVGGTSGDHITFKEDQKVASDCHSKKICNSLDTYTVGPDYFNALRNFQASHWSIQAPMGDEMNIEDTMDFLQQAWGAATNEGTDRDRVAAIALGNEPNWYKKYGIEGYIERSQMIENRVTERFSLKGEEARIFQTGEIAAEVASKKDSPSKFTLMDLLTTLFKGEHSQVKYAAEHYYQVIGQKGGHNYTTSDLQDTLMNHFAIRDKLASYVNDANPLSIKDKSIPLVISEAGSAIGHTALDFAGGFGAAIWAVDFHLAAMSHGIKRVCNTHGPDAMHAWWLPDDTSRYTNSPAVQGIFPAAAYIADFVGKDGKLGKVREIDLNNEFFSGYVMYDLESSKPIRIALINLRQFETGPAVRPRFVATVDVGTGVKSAVVHRMQSEYGASARGFDIGGPQENVTWDGEQWSYKVETDKGKGHMLPGYKEERLSVNNIGQIEVNVWDTEAVIVSLQ
ncbi:uncharacterized protein N7482_002501 [Penicillium canariense]|uniref:Beta-glucuronidase C-terminal domain-containing protein n=1 Tax=Penicillium canariense TaxID=189055 RepID=A0A9W9IHX4_9EURO|nr:uncharacterized protein N7482_002501 [Penicillium canariense]KAJ5176624.1 hypothetical protein N7482_002501 [Penicillium canariense]